MPFEFKISRLIYSEAFQENFQQFIFSLYCILYNFVLLVISMAEAEINLFTNLNKSSYIMSVTLVCEDQRFSAHKRLK